MPQPIKHAFMLVIAITLLGFPGGISGQQHRLPVVDLPELGIGGLVLHPALPEDGLTLADIHNIPAPREESDPPFHAYIVQAAETYDVDAALIRAIILAESSFNPMAVSNRGAQGLMQLMPATARALGVEDSFDPAVNIDAGVRYFRKMLDRFDGDVTLALAAYNAGSRHVRNYGGVPPFGATRHYIQKVLEYKERYQNETAAGQGDGPTV